MYRQEIDKGLTQLNLPTTNDKNNINKVIENFNSIISKAADLSIPNIKIKTGRTQVPWWNDQCEAALKASKHAFNRYKKHNTITNKIEHNKRKAILRKTLKDTKKNYWLQFTQTLNAQTPSTVIWKNIRRIQGKIKSNRITVLKNENNKIL